jgi:two-component system chemotaxis response regulator CheB
MSHGRFFGPERTAAVVIVDDSPYFRYQLGTRLRQQGLTVAASLTSGEEAVQQVAAINPDLVLMDIVMPGMSGLDAVKEIRTRWSGPIVMMSAATPRTIQETWHALEAGANDFIAKPDVDHPIDTMIAAIMDRLGAIAAARRGDPQLEAARPASFQDVRSEGFRVLVMGASTGGPRALGRLFESLGRAPAIPILVVQHMPSGFTRSFADRLAAILGSPVVEAPPDGTALSLRGSPIVVAAGGLHLRLGQNSCWAEPGDRRHGVIPSVDVTLLDAARVYGRGTAAVILTGMGEDGAQGARDVRGRGGVVVVESRESALVWGMPGAVVAHAGADAVWPLPDIAEWIDKVVSFPHAL